jgi:hypothetical protein
MSENQASTINENVENQDKKDEDDLKSKKFTVTKLEVDDEALNVLGEFDLKGKVFRFSRC